MAHTTLQAEAASKTLQTKQCCIVLGANTANVAYFWGKILFAINFVMSLVWCFVFNLLYVPSPAARKVFFIKFKLAKSLWK